MYKEKILGMLRSSGSAFLSGEELARKCGISRTMVWKHIRTLEREGFVIESQYGGGYRITAAPDLLRVSDIKKGLKTGLIGREIHLLPSVDSTNTHAMELASHGAAEGTVVLAETQTGGKGRRGRKWVSPQGNLYLSVILRPDIPLVKAPLVTLMAAVAVARELRERDRLNAGIKWPNDILIAGKKTSGVLTEMSAEQDRIRHIVVGIGINVNMDVVDLPPDLRELTTTLRAETGGMLERNAFVQRLLRELDRSYADFLRNEQDMLNAWKAFNVTTGNRVTVSEARGSFAGLAENIDEEGRLIVVLDDGTRRTVAAGDVTIVRK